MSCHDHNDDINKCMNIRINKNMKKYNCDFIIHDKKPSLCIKQGHLKKYKNYSKKQHFDFNIKERIDIKIPKINIKQANSDTKRYINKDVISLTINNKSINPDTFLLKKNDHVSNLIKGLLSPGFHNDLSINTFKYCDFIKKVFITNKCADYIMCNTEIGDIAIHITSKAEKATKFTITLFLKGDMTCLKNDQTVNKRNVKNTNIKILWNKNKPEHINIKYLTPNKNYLYSDYKKKIKEKKIQIEDNEKAVYGYKRLSSR